jgi:hypothetical protein
VKRKALIFFVFAVSLMLVLPLPASAALLPSAWAENDLELAGQWGLLDARSDSYQIGASSGSRDVFSSRQGSARGSRGLYGNATGLSNPESYTAGITKDEFSQIVVTMCEKILDRSMSEISVRFDDGGAPGYYYKAYEAGIVNGAGVTKDGAIILRRDEKLSREQIAKMLYQAIIYCCPDEKVGRESAAASLKAFSDRGKISDWALSPAAYMVNSGILKGSGGKLHPKDQCTFEEGVILAKRVYESFEAKQTLLTAPMLESGLSAPVMLSPQGSTARMSVKSGVKLKWQEMGGVEQYLVKIDYPGATQTQRIYTSDTEIEMEPRENKTLNAGQMSVSIAAVDEDSNVISPATRLDLTLYNDTAYKNDAAYKFDFQSSAEAAKNMTMVTIKVWDLDSSGKKVTRTKNLTVHKYIAEDVVAIFDEIYNGPEKFPIHSVSGYRAGTSGEHSKGTAIDINPNENYEVYSDGRVGTGSFWKPGQNPYSIPENGDAVKAFRAHGWGWGGTDWKSKKDYMHFSYFGT